MKFGPPKRVNPPPHYSSTSPATTLIPHLPPAALQWCTAASAAAAISYADRGTTAIAASSLLDELQWSEGQLGEVQSAFFVGYALTQVLGGILGGATAGAPIDRTDNNGGGPPTDRTGGYRTILPLSLFLTGVTTLLFPLAATLGGPSWASADRLCLGLLEGLLLPAAMAGVSDTTKNTVPKPSNNFNLDKMSKTDDASSQSAMENKDCDEEKSSRNIKATASSIVIAGCYMGSAWAYLSAWLLYSERFQIQIQEWGYVGSVWPLVFYINGILSMGCLFLFQEEFNLFESLGSISHQFAPKSSGIGNTTIETSTADYSLSTQNSLLKETLSIANATLSSKSGRAIIAAQIGQGALLYSIASWGPLYLERITSSVHSTSNMIDVASSTPSESAMLPSASSISSVAVTASIAASSLIFPQITQALVGITIGAAADKLSLKFGTRITRRTLQLISGVGPAVVLWYLTSQVGSGGESGNADLLSPALLFGTAQTISALSLGAVSVSHLDIATSSSAGAVYALGNVAAAASGSLMVNLFGRLLEDGVTDGTSPSGASSEMSVGGGAEFALPFQLVAILSAVGSLIYACTVDTELEIGFNETSANA